MSDHSGTGSAAGGAGRARGTGQCVRSENLTTQQTRASDHDALTLKNTHQGLSVVAAVALRNEGFRYVSGESRNDRRFVTRSRSGLGPAPQASGPDFQNLRSRKIATTPEILDNRWDPALEGGDTWWMSTSAL